MFFYLLFSFFFLFINNFEDVLYSYKLCAKLVVCNYVIEEKIPLKYIIKTFTVLPVIADKSVKAMKKKIYKYLKLIYLGNKPKMYSYNIDCIDYNLYHLDSIHCKKTSEALRQSSFVHKLHMLMYRVIIDIYFNYEHIIGFKPIKFYLKNYNSSIFIKLLNLVQFVLLSVLLATLYFVLTLYYLDIELTKHLVI